MGRRSNLQLGGALALFLGTASGQDSCVQVSNVSFAPSCPCGAGSELTFQVEGETSVEANKINVAVIIDASGSIFEIEGAFPLEKEFAKNVTASFAARNLFTNGGTASYATFSDDASDGGTFGSEAEFNEFVDNASWEEGDTNIEAGLSKGRELLANGTSTRTSFLILVTDGDWNLGGDPQIEADAARDEGIIVYAVGVGPDVSKETLRSIGGNLTFNASTFTELDNTLDEIISASVDSIPCAATGAVITVEFNGMVTAASGGEGGSIPATVAEGGNVVVFEVPNLEGTPTSFEVVLDTCGETEGGAIVADVSYVDEEDNEPDLTSIEVAGVVPTCDVTPSPTHPTSEIPTLAGTKCSFGIYGVESDNGRVCCVAECGACGGVGCSRFSPDLGADDCCVTDILLDGEACSATGTAPCYFDDCAVRGLAPKTISTPAPNDEFNDKDESTPAPFTPAPERVTPAPSTPAPARVTPAPSTPTPAPVTPAPTPEDDFSFSFDFSFSYSYDEEPWYDNGEDGTPVSVTESFTVKVPELNETSVDFGLLVDVSSSYAGDIANLKLLAGDLVHDLAASTANLALALGSFSDIEERTGINGSEYTMLKDFGSCSDEVCFEQEQDEFVLEVDTLDADMSGTDSTSSEAQTIGLYRAATEWAWRDGVLKVLAITTDNSFHVPGDGYGYDDEYYTLDEVITACNEEGIKILALKAGNAGDEMDYIGEGTGGVVETTQADSADIVGAILQGFAGVQYSKVRVEWVCEDSSWSITVDPSSDYENVDGGATLEFTVTVSVPAGTTVGTSCAANVLADEVLVGSQTFTTMTDGSVTVESVMP